MTMKRESGQMSVSAVDAFTIATMSGQRRLDIQ